MSGGREQERTGDSKGEGKELGAALGGVCWVSFVQSLRREIPALIDGNETHQQLM